MPNKKYETGVKVEWNAETEEWEVGLLGVGKGEWPTEALRAVAIAFGELWRIGEERN